MSEEQIKAFIAQIQVDISLLEQIKAECADTVAIENEAGLNITVAEFMRNQAQAVGELSDEDIESCMGNTTLYPCHTNEVF